MNLKDMISSSKLEASPLSLFFVPPKKVIWASEEGVSGEDVLLRDGPGQTILTAESPFVKLEPANPKGGALVLDFGVELQGYLELFMPAQKGGKIPKKARIRLGESVSEVMSELGGEKNAGNDHAIRDQVVELPSLGKKIVGPSGFRFVRIDNVTPDIPLHISEVRAVLQIRDIPYLGSFESDDPRLNQIWKTGAYTVHLNMQEYLWDGIKRDRLVWIGDLHPEVCTVNAVFGNNPVVADSLDLIRDITPPTKWMNTISSYSIWWVLIHEEQYQHHGDLAYLKEQKDYLIELLKHLSSLVEDHGRECLDGGRFLDWPTKADPVAVHEGLQALLYMAMKKGADLLDVLEEKNLAVQCRDNAKLLKRHSPQPSGRKAPAALLALAGLKNPKDVCGSTLLPGGPKDVSTFYGFYVLNALGEAGHIEAAQELISTYWGGMLDLGATTFWEDFDLEWTKGAGRIDELTPEEMTDIHGDFGAYCYKGFRHSFCHGWASGPTAWLSRYVLGVVPLKPGFAKVRIRPHMGKLKTVEGTYPTPYGVIHVRHRKRKDGSIESKVDLPRGVKLED